MHAITGRKFEATTASVTLICACASVPFNRLAEQRYASTTNEHGANISKTVVNSKITSPKLGQAMKFTIPCIFAS